MTETRKPGIRASSFDIDTVLSPAAANALRSMIERRFPGLLKQGQWKLRSSSGRNIVFGLSSNNPGPHPRSMIVKCPVPRRGSVQRNNHEVTSMQYLRALPHGDLSRLASETYAHDPEHGIFAMEDLAVSRGARCLEDLLRSDSPQPAVASLQSLAQTLGKMHFHTFTRRSAHTNGRPGEYRSWLMPDFARTLTVLRQKMRKFGSTLDICSIEELRQIDGLLHRDGVWAFCHGDVSPKNVLISPEGIHLCDFESAGLRHPILEGIQLGWIFPFSLEAGGIPASVTEGMKAAYRCEFDFERAIGRGILDKVEAAALVVFLLYHWVYTFPEVGLPIAYAGSSAKVRELMQLLYTSSSDFHFPNVTRLLRHLDQAMEKETLLAPERSILYECFRDNSSTVVATAHNEETEDCRQPQPVSGVFRVNRSCHLVIKKRDSRSVGVYILEYPHIRCTASRTNSTTFRAIEMPLELSYTATSKVTVRDLRTSKTIQICRERISIAVLRHLRQLREIFRYHRSTVPVG